MNIPWNKGIKTGLVPKTAFKKGYKQSPELVAKRLQSRMGYKHSEETKAKIGAGNKGKQSWSKGLTGIVRAKHKFSPRPNSSRENNYRWVENRMLLKDDHKDRKGQLHKDWSKRVKDRDGWKCRISNENCEGRMEAHHILSWSSHPELRYEINNGITLCHAHHPKKRAEEVELAPMFQGLISAIAN